MMIVFDEKGNAKVTAEDYNDIFWEDFDEEESGIVMVEEGKWESDYKWENKRVVIQHKETGNFYALYQSRSGSYYSDYHYDEPDTDKDGMVTLDQVFQETITKVVYR